MRSPERSHLRAVPGPPGSPELPVVAAQGADITSLIRLAHDAAQVDGSQHVAVHLLPDGDDLVLGLLPLGEAHPFTVLAGFSAPPEWSCFGLRVRGRARHLDEPSTARPTAVTFLVSRHLGEASLMELDGEPQVTTSRAEGVLPDLCRRVLGLATDPAPPTTAPLWLVMWLDRVVARCLDPDRAAAQPVTWGELAALHPALDDPNAKGQGLDPAALVALAHRHTSDWSWTRLRSQPGLVPLPDGVVPADIAAWMDDGFFARWCLQGFPEASTLAHDLAAVLPGPVREPLVTVMRGAAPS